MKNIYFVLLSVVIFATSCSNKPDDDHPKGISFGISTNSLVVPISDPDNAFAIPDCQYKFQFNPDRTAVVNLKEISFGNFGDFSFSGKGTYQFGTLTSPDNLTGPSVWRLNVPAFVSNDNSIDNFKCVLTDGFWDDEWGTVGSRMSKMTIMSYTVNDQLSVRTFPTNACYVGSTKIYTNNGSALVKTFNKLNYVVSIDVKKKKAVVTLINPDMHLMGMPENDMLRLSDLNIEYSTRGYFISGTDVCPQRQNGAVWDDVTEYKMTKFYMEMTDETLTRTNVEFITTEGYKGSLQGGNCLVYAL